MLEAVTLTMPALVYLGYRLLGFLRCRSASDI